MADEKPVFVIDDDDAVRDSILFVLKSAGITARGHRSATEFLASPDADVFGCIVSDIRMPGISGIELLQELRTRGHATPVIVITGHGDVPLAVEAMKLGASEFIEKPFDDEALLAAIRDALGRVAHDGQREARQSDVRDKVALLSERERQVMAGLVRGNPNKIIASDLGISPRTVEVYRANLMTKMQAGSLSELVRMAILIDWSE